MKKSVLFVSLFSLITLSLAAQDPALYRTIDGSENNADNPEWGAAHTNLLPFAGVGFADGFAAPAGPDRPNPRYLSNLIFNQPELLPDPLTLSDFTWVFGQFMDHDIGLTENNDEPLDIDVPMGDPDFDPLGFGTVKIPMNRNAFMEGTGTDPENPRLYINEITAFIDGSAVYGSDIERANWLRSFSGGKMKVSTGNLLPYNTIDGEFDSPIDPNAPHMADDVGMATRLFVAGDVRANENPLLCSFHTLFVLEHNRQCDLLAAAHPDWNDEQLYLHARKIVSGLIQSITYNQWLPTMGVEIEAYTAYDPTVNPQLSNTFTAAAFRMGHTLLNSTILRVDPTGNELPEGHLSLRFGFFNPGVIPEVNGIEPYLAGMAQQTQQNMDSRIVDDVRNFLFGPPGAGGLDLAAININRGRERGLPSYNDIREAYGLPRYQFLEQITPEIETYSQIFEAYIGDIDKIDPWVAMLAEQELNGQLFGPTILRIMEVQFQALRDGDRFFYLNDPVLSEAEKTYIHETTFRDIIMHNTGIEIMQDNVFMAMPYEDICGNMTIDLSGGVYVHTTDEIIPDVRVNLLVDGEAVNNSFTNGSGNFAFVDLAACNPVELSPELEGYDWINGVTIQDLVILSRHILGIEEITDPYQLLAADANLDGDLRVQDIIAIRRLILDLDEALPGDLPQWVFIPSEYTFTDPLNPWNDDYPTSLSLGSPTMMLDNQNFTALKRGDVNASAIINTSLQGETPVFARTATPGLMISGEDVRLAANEATPVTLRLTATAPIAAYQYSLEMTSGQILSADGITLDPGFINLTQRGKLRFCGEQAVDQEALLQLVVESPVATKLSDLLQFAETDLSGFALTDNQEVVRIGLDLQSSEEVTFASNVLAAYPNPFNEQIRFSLPIKEAGEGELRIYDINGRLALLELRDWIDVGNYAWPVDTDLAAGHYIYEIQVGQQLFRGRIVSAK